MFFIKCHLEFLLFVFRYTSGTHYDHYRDVRHMKLRLHIKLHFKSPFSSLSNEALSYQKQLLLKLNLFVLYSVYLIFKKYMSDKWCRLYSLREKHFKNKII